MLEKNDMKNPFQQQLDLKTINDKIESITDFVTDVTPDKNGLMLSSDKKKLDGIEDNANNYEHPLKHNADIITETEDKQFVSASEKQKWNNVDNKADVDHTHTMSDMEGLSLNAKDILIEDKNNVFDATNVEDALYEILNKQLLVSKSLIESTKQIIDKLC